MTGRRLGDAAHRDRPGLRVLFFTSCAENTAVGTGHLKAVMHVRTKPFGIDALARRIRDQIGIAENIAAAQMALL